MRFIAGAILLTVLATLSIVYLIRGWETPGGGGALDDRVRAIADSMAKEWSEGGGRDDISDRIEAVEAGLDLLNQRLRARDYNQAAAGDAGAENTGGDAGSPGEQPKAPAVRAHPILLRAVSQISPADRSRLLLSSSMPQLRQRALGELTRLAFGGDEEAKQALRDALTDPDPDIRSQAIDRLGRLGDVEAIPAIAAMLHEDEDPRIRSQAAEALGNMRDPSVAGTLALALGDTEVRVQSRALRSIGRVGGSQAIPAVEAYVKEAPGEQRIQGIRTLRELGDNRLYEAEVRRQNEVLTSEEQKVEVKREAIRTLASLGGDEARKVVSSLAGQEGNPLQRDARAALSRIEGRGRGGRGGPPGGGARPGPARAGPTGG